MKKEKYTLPINNETGIVSMPFFGPASQEEAIERIETAEKEYAKTGKAYDAFKMLEEFRKELK